MGTFHLENKQQEKMNMSKSVLFSLPALWTFCGCSLVIKALEMVLV